jgi:hypothetical protein
MNFSRCATKRQKVSESRTVRKGGQHVFGTNSKIECRNCLFGGIYGTGMNPSLKLQIIRHPNFFLTSILNAMDPMSISRIISTA